MLFTPSRPLLLLVLSCLTVLWSGEAGQSAQLVVWNRTLVEFRAPLGFASVQERAEQAAKRIAALPNEALTLPIEARPSTVGTASGVMLHAGPYFLFAIAEADLVSANNETMTTVSQLAVERTRELFAARLASGRPETLQHGLMVTSLSTVGLLLALFLLWRLSALLNRKIHAGLFARLPTVFGFDLRGFALELTKKILRLPLLLAALTSTYFWLMFSLSGFPYTQPLATALGAWLWDLTRMFVRGIADALPGIFVVLVIVLLTRSAVNVLKSFFDGVEEGRLQVGWMQPETARATRRIAVALLWLFAIIVAYPYMPGSSSDAFKGMSIFAGLVLTLGSSGMVNQVMSGLMVVYARSMRPGDIVQIGDIVGTVLDLGLLSTKVRTSRQEEITIPNAVLVGSSVINHSRHDHDGMVLHSQVTIGYDAAWRQVHAMLILAAGRTPGIRQSPEPYVVQKSLDDFYVAYELRVRMTTASDRWAVLSNLHAHIQDVFNEHGVQIMSPHFESQPTQPVLVPKGAWTPAPAKPGSA